MEQLVGAALLCGVARLSVARLPSTWWTIWSAQDWLPAGNVRRAFERIIRFPQGGPNGIRPEILLSAFASSVVTASGEGIIVIKGSTDQELDKFISEASPVGRLIAFRA